MFHTGMSFAPGDEIEVPRETVHRFAQARSTSTNEFPRDLYAGEKATACALDAIQLLGGAGYVNDSPPGRLSKLPIELVSPMQSFGAKVQYVQITRSTASGSAPESCPARVPVSRRRTRSGSATGRLRTTRRRSTCASWTSCR